MDHRNIGDFREINLYSDYSVTGDFPAMELMTPEATTVCYSWWLKTPGPLESEPLGDGLLPRIFSSYLEECLTKKKSAIDGKVEGARHLSTSRQSRCA